MLRKRLIHLHRCRGISRRTIVKMLHDDPQLDTPYKLSSTQMSQRYRLPFKNSQLLYADLHNPHLLNEIKRDLATYPVLTIVDENYPAVLKTIKDPPLVLYALGDLTLANKYPALSVIGTRSPSRYAFAKMDHIVRPLIYLDWIIVSGMAKGIDSYAHWLALNHSGKTIAVLGGGFHHIYPKQNIKLFNQIKQNGLLLSEYAPNTPPQRFHFPERNRIISGLSFATLVIEAMERSGTLITVDQALDQGREVYAVPDSPLVAQAKGCLQMIQDGAKLIHDASDIMEDWTELERFWDK